LAFQVTLIPHSHCWISTFLQLAYQKTFHSLRVTHLFICTFTATNNFGQSLFWNFEIFQSLEISVNNIAGIHIKVTSPFFLRSGTS
jgi:hypothetical protein